MTLDKKIDQHLASLESINSSVNSSNNSVTLAAILAAVIAITALVTNFQSNYSAGTAAETAAVNALTAKFPTVTAVQSVSPTITTVGKLIVDTNPNRKGFILYNNSANSVYITYASSGNAATPTIIVPTFAHYLHLGQPFYTGPLFGIRNAGTGTVAITEFN